MHFTVDCTVFGFHPALHAHDDGHPVSLRWRDGRWSPLAFTVPPGVTQVHPESVSCPATGSCVAVGAAVRPAVVGGKRRHPVRALVLHQHGDTWIARILPVARSISRLARGLRGNC